jgi:type II secretion system protein N
MTGTTLKDKFLRWLLYSIVGSLTFYLTFTIMMDWEIVKARVVLEMEKLSGYDVAVGEVSFGFSSIKIEDIVLVDRVAEEGGRKSRFLVSRMEIKSNPISLMKGEKSIAFDLDTLGGNIAGSFEKTEFGKIVELELENIRINKVPFIASAITLPLKGKISMDGKVELGRHGWRKANGEFNITMKNIIVGNGKTKVKASFLQPPKTKGQAQFQKEGFPLPPLNLGDSFSWTVTIKNGKAEINDFVTSSKDGEAELVGHIKFRDPMRLSMAEMYLKFKFAEEAKKKSDTLEVFELSLVKRGKRQDGYMGLSISGQLGKLRFIPRKSGIIDRKNRNKGKNGKSRSRRSTRKIRKPKKSRMKKFEKRNRAIGKKPFRPVIK